MYRRPYLTALGLSLVSILGIIGQMVTAGAANTAFLAISVAPVIIGLACLRWNR